MNHRCRNIKASPVIPTGNERRRSFELASLRPQVLLAEDDEIIRSLLLAWLQDEGYEVEIARDGEEAWRILERHDSPKLVVMDWMMPGVDGIEICRRLREKKAEF